MSNGALYNFEVENNIEEWTLDHVIQAEQYFQISHQAMLRRLRMLDKITQETADEYSPDIKYNAELRGYDLKLYEPYSEQKNMILGNYIKLINKSYENDLISISKMNELLIDGFYDNLVYN